MKLGYFDGQKAYEILLNLQFDMKTAQKLCDKGRMHGENGILAKNDLVFGEAHLIDYECEPKGLKPIYEMEKFAVFDKPSGVLTHPNGRHCEYSLCDEIWALWGKEACVAHRLDRETSGVIIVSKNKNSTASLKQIFEKRDIQKRYLAFVNGKFEPNPENFLIDENIATNTDSKELKTRMKIDKNGKRSITLVKVLKHYENFNATLVECQPLTGRQHQIRVHMAHIKHPILGDPLYSVSAQIAADILDLKLSQAERIKLSGAKRLMLHSNSLKFSFEQIEYNIKSKIDFLKELEDSICLS